MLPFGTTATEFASVTFVSAFVGVFLTILGSRHVKVRYLAGFAVGIYLWYFPDTLGGANYLDISGGFVYSNYLLSLVLLFIVGLATFFALDGGRVGRSGVGSGALLAGVLAAVALGVHGMAEGAAFGITSAQTTSSSVIDAFGGLAPSASWVLHKALEPAIAAVAYVAVAGAETKKTSEMAVDALAIATAFVIPAVVGSVAGYYTAFDYTYVYALGLGTSVYAFMRVGRSLYADDGSGASLSLKMALAIVLGFLMIFIAAMLHS